MDTLKHIRVYDLIGYQNDISVKVTFFETIPYCNLIQQLSIFHTLLLPVPVPLEAEIVSPPLPSIDIGWPHYKFIANLLEHSLSDYLL